MVSFCFFLSVACAHLSSINSTSPIRLVFPYRIIGGRTLPSTSNLERASVVPRALDSDSFSVCLSLTSRRTRHKAGEKDKTKPKRRIKG